MELVEIDGFHAQAPQTRFTGLFQVSSPAVRSKYLSSAHEAALGRDQNLSAIAPPGAKSGGEKPLVRTRIVGIGPIDVRRIEEANSGVERSVKEVDGSIAGETHRSHADARRTRGRYPHSLSVSRLRYRRLPR
jgi:hypothetical protein